MIVTFAVATLAVIYVGVLRTRPLPRGSYTRSFDSDSWRAEGSDRASPPSFTERQKMLGDLVERVLPGKNRQEIETLLGRSDQTGYFTATGRDLIYPLGWERGSYITIDSEWLLIWLDQSGHFARYGIYND